MAASDLYAQLKEFDEQYILFPAFVAAKDAIESNLRLFRESGVAKHMLVSGEAGTGKTSLCKWLSEEHPLRELPERNLVELLIAPVPPSATVSSITDAMLKALGDPYPGRGTNAAIARRVVTLCRGCGVEMLLFDEAQHLHDRGGSITHYMVADWVKSLIDELGVPTVLLGLPRVENLLQTNDQLRRRFSTRRCLALGQSDTLSIEDECLELFNSLASPIKLPVSTHPYSPQEMGSRLYYGSDGRVAHIKKLLFAALRQALELDIDKIDAQMLQTAFVEEIWWEGVGKLNPFHPEFEFRRLDRGGEPFQFGEPARTRKRQ